MAISLDEFAKQVQERLSKVSAAKGKETEKLQMELSAFITENTQALMAQGVPINKIQDALRAATEPAPQTGPPNADDDPGGDIVHRISSIWDADEITHFLPMDGSMISDLLSGRISKKDFIDILSRTSEATDIMDSLELHVALEVIDKDGVLDDAMGDGDVVTGPSGNALIPERLELTDEEGRVTDISEPAVFKSAEEVREIAAKLSRIDENIFFSVKIKDLVDAELIDDEDSWTDKKEAADEIIGELRDMLTELRDVYNRAAEQKKGMLIFVGYQVNGSEDDWSPELYTEEEWDAVETHISARFGKYENVFHEIVSPDIHVDICVIDPTPKHNYYILVTMGMGAHRMNVPAELKDGKIDRAELLIALPPDWDIKNDDERWYWPIRWLKILARLPGEYDTWLGYGHTVPNGEPFAENTELSGVMITMPYYFGPEAAVCVLPDGDKINFYQVVPLYEDEMDFKIAYDAESLESLFPEDFDMVLDIGRKNVVRNKKG